MDTRQGIPIPLRAPDIRPNQVAGRCAAAQHYGARNRFVGWRPVDGESERTLLRALGAHHDGPLRPRPFHYERCDRPIRPAAQSTLPRPLVRLVGRNNVSVGLHGPSCGAGCSASPDADAVKSTITALILLVLLAGCARGPDPNTIVMVIESSPANLDPRVGTDGPSERIDELIFDALLRRDDHFNVQPGIAERCKRPDPLTYIFHLRQVVRFHDGKPLTSNDVQ